jgi:hypothetical protein
MFESKVACNMCTRALGPLDWFLENPTAQAVMDDIAEQICIKEGIEGGKKSVCDGAIVMMTKSLLPAMTEGILSPQRICDELLHVCKSPTIKELDADAYV